MLEPIEIYRGFSIFRLEYPIRLGLSIQPFRYIAEPQDSGWPGQPSHGTVPELKRMVDFMYEHETTPRKTLEQWRTELQAEFPAI